MRRKLVGGSIVVVLAAVAVWLLWIRDRGAGAKTDKPDGSARSAQLTPVDKAPAKAADEPAAPRSMAPRWSLDVDPEGPITLEGQVVGPDGKGVAKAEVWLGSVPPRTAVTEDDGTFSFDKLVGRTYTLSAKSGKLIGDLQYKLTDKSDPAVIHLAEGAAVIVTVVDEAKAPLPNIEVSSGFTVAARATTDAKGEATLQPLTPGYALIEATAAGFAPGTGFATIGSAGSTARLTITMHKGYSISGRVIDETGKPIAKARVSVDGERDFDREALEDVGAGKPSGGAVTDDKGQFRIAAVAAGTHTLRAVDGEHAPARSAPINVDGRAVSGVEITMQVGGVLAGTVVDAGGKPVAYATVRVAGAGAQLAQVAARQATTDQQGVFELRGVARAKLQARAESDTAASKIADVDLVEQRERRDLKLVLDVSGTIAGVVVDGKGAPVAEVQVNAFPDILGGASTDGLALAGLSSATTDGGGNFKITGLPDGAYRLWAARPGGMFGGFAGQSTPAKTGDKAVRITLAAPGAIKGTIAIDGAGPPKLATVAIGWQAPTPAQDGAFELTKLDPGSYDVRFTGPDFAELVKRDVKVEPGATVDLGVVTVHRGRKITGKVVDGKGQPVRGATIKVGELILFSDDTKPDDDDDNQPSGPTRSAVSDGDGYFSIIGISPKATSIAADHPTAGRSASVAIPDGAADPAPVTLALRGFGSISGKVTQKGKPMAGVSITQSSKAGGAQLSAAQTDDQGNYTLKKVPEGTVTLQAMQEKMLSLKSTTVTVQVTAGKETKQNIDIPVGDITLTVQIKPIAGAKVDAAQVFLFAGTIVPANGKQLLDAFIAGGAQGMKFWFGEGKPLPEFDELVPGAYSVCSIPITGDMSDPKLMQRINENVATLKVYCRQTRLPASPQKQTFTQELPAMTPLPEPATN